MKRPLAAIALIGAVGLMPGAGQADGVTAGSCLINGTVNYASPVTAAPAGNDFTITADLICYRADANGMNVVGETFGGTLAGDGSGLVSCVGGTTSGAFTADFPTGEGKRELWSATFGSAGGRASAAYVTIKTIEQQTFNEGTQEWDTTSSQTVSPVAAGGALTVAPADATTCAGDGFSTAVANGRIAFGFNATTDV